MNVMHRVFVVIFVALAATAHAEPTTAPTTLPWESNAAFPTPTGNLAPLIAGHAERWQTYSKLPMTRVDESPAFAEKLADALRAQMVGLPDAPTEAWEHWETGQPLPPLPTTSAFAPDGPLDDVAFKTLVRDVHDVLLYLQGRPFADGRARFLAQRVPSVPYPDLFNAAVTEQWGEVVDAKTMTEAQRWTYIQRFYEARYATMNGGFAVTGAALDDERGAIGAAWLHTGATTNVDWIYYLQLTRGNIDYWRGRLLHCGLPITEPAPTAEAILARDGKILRAQLDIVLEFRNGERAPISIMAFYDPASPHWGFEGMCMTSSPFEASVISTR